jgi:ATP synthase protein I
MKQAQKKPDDTKETQKKGQPESQADIDRASRNSGLGMAMRMGTEMVVATMLGSGFGYWLDKQLDTQPWMLILFLVLGSIAGFKNVYRIVNPVITDSIEDQKSKTIK